MTISINRENRSNPIAKKAWFQLPKIFLCVSVFLLCSISNAQSIGPHISVSGNATISTKPDQAQINLSVNTQAIDSATAKAELDKKVNAFFDALNDMGIDDEDIVARSMNISAQYDYQNRQQKFIGFQASRSIVVELSDLDKIHPVLDTAVAMKVDGIQGIQYASSKEDELREQARAEAIKDSITKATDIAQAYDAKLGPVDNINYHSSNTNQPITVDAFRAQGLLSESESAGGRFIPGDITITDNISVSFSLIPNR